MMLSMPTLPQHFAELRERAGADPDVQAALASAPSIDADPDVRDARAKLAKLKAAAGAKAAELVEARRVAGDSPPTAISVEIATLLNDGVTPPDLKARHDAARRVADLAPVVDGMERAVADAGEAVARAEQAATDRRAAAVWERAAGGLLDRAIEDLRRVLADSARAMELDAMLRAAGVSPPRDPRRTALAVLLDSSQAGNAHSPFSRVFAALEQK